MAAIGKVYEERLVIAIGSGGNGKSTFFNAIQDVLGDYAGTIRSELMIASNDSGKKFEYARLRGKRFIVAEELEEGKQLDTAAIKHLCSTGDINAQFKGKDIFTFKPSHSTVLCTNHMPSVKAVDNGTWDRLIAVPFNGRFRNQATEIKNYGAYLVENCGGAILSWIIAGAQKYIHNDYKLIIPEAIKAVTKEYQAENDWAADFFSTCLSFEPDLSATASDLYSAYTTYCQGHRIQPLPSTKVMPRIAEHYGVTKKRTKRCFLYTGVGLSKPESMILLEASAGECIEESKDTDWDDIIELLGIPTPPAQQNSQPN
jgi:P4 family phage/plasmid primase-like protien